MDLIVILTPVPGDRKHPTVLLLCGITLLQLELYSGSYAIMVRAFTNEPDGQPVLARCLVLIKTVYLITTPPACDKQV